MSLSTIAYYTLLYTPLAYIALILALYSLSALSLLTPRTTFTARTLTAYGTLVICALYGALASIYSRAVGDPYRSQYLAGRSFHHLMYYSTNIRFEIVSGKEHLNRVRPAVLIGNHQSALDVLMLGTIWPRYCSVTAKKSLKWMPFLGWFMALSGTVFIDRSNRQSAIAAFDVAAEQMRAQRQSVFIFPEGTRSNAPGPTMGQFKKGAFHLAVRAQVPILPIVVANYHGVLSLKERRFRAGRIPVVVMDPVETTGLGEGDVEPLMGRVREAMMRQLVELTESPLGMKSARAEVSAAEEDLAGLVEERARVDRARASGVER